MAFLAGMLGSAASGAASAATSFGGALAKMIQNPTVGNLLGGTTFGGSKLGTAISETPIKFGANAKVENPADKLSTLLDLSQLLR